MLESAYRRIVGSRFARFLLVGGLNTAFGYGVFALAITAGLAPEIALLVATVLGVVFNFATTGRLVFGNGSGNRLPRFCLVYGLIYLLNAAALRLLMAAGLSAFVAQALLVPVAAAVSFQLMRVLVFSERPA